MGSAEEPRILAGAVSAELRDEFPGLVLLHADVPGGARRSSRPVKARLAAVADRISGAQAVNLRHRPIPWAYRVFFRHIGLDPDEQRTPVEELTFERIASGGLASRGLPADAIRVSTLESHVALRALDADAVAGALTLRTSLPGEQLAERPGLPAGTLVLADERRPLATLFGGAAADAEVGAATRMTRLCAIGVEGVPRVALEEAIWVAAELLES
ncbi:hypothetical protein HJD18_04350 [Thermoleophilia bacterium SCSIO 60948]|nr:hypothetical protein HJD18_04350 [Thermoleophilia bacterium SCSIO 60948]